MYPFIPFFALCVAALFPHPVFAGADEDRLVADYKAYEAAKESYTDYKILREEAGKLPENRRQDYFACNGLQDSIGRTKEDKNKTSCEAPWRKGIPSDAFYQGYKKVVLDVRQDTTYRYPPATMPAFFNHDTVLDIFTKHLEKNALPFAEPDATCEKPQLIIADPKARTNIRETADIPVSADDTLNVIVNLAYNPYSSPPSATINYGFYRWRAGCRALAPQDTGTINVPLHLPKEQLHAMVNRALWAKGVSSYSGIISDSGVKGYKEPPSPARELHPMARYYCETGGERAEIQFFTARGANFYHGFQQYELKENPIQGRQGDLFFRLDAPNHSFPLCKLKDRDIQFTAGSVGKLDIAETTNGGAYTASVDMQGAWILETNPENNVTSTAYRLSLSGGEWQSCPLRYSETYCNAAPMKNGRLEDFSAVAVRSEAEYRWRSQAEKGDIAAQAKMCRILGENSSVWGSTDAGECMLYAERGVDLCAISSAVQRFLPDIDLVIPTRKGSDVQAAMWCLNAARAGDSNAQGNVALAYAFMAHNKKMPSEFSRALAWYEKGAQGGNAKAQGALAEHLINVEYSEKYNYALDAKRAAELALSSAEQGDGNGIQTIAYLYMQGYGVPQNFEEAYFWYSLLGAAFDLPSWHLTAEQVLRVQERRLTWQPKKIEK